MRPPAAAAAAAAIQPADDPDSLLSELQLPEEELFSAAVLSLAAGAGFS